MTMKNKKLIAFDMYDTFVHIPKGPNPYRESFAQLWMHGFFLKQLAETLQTTDKDIKDMIPKTFASHPHIDDILIDLQSVIQQQLSWTSLYEDFLPTITALKQTWYSTAVISNLSKPYNYPLFHLIPKDAFDYKILSYEVGMKKPDRKIFDHLKKISWYKSDEIVMVGDNLKSDVEWAKNAGIDAIHIDRTSSGILFCDWYTSISTLSQLLEVFKIKND